MDILYRLIQNILINILLLNHASIYIKEKIEIHDIKYIFLSTIVKSTYIMIAVTFLVYLCSCNFILFKSQIHLSLITVRNNNTYTNLIPLINIICNIALLLFVLIVSLTIFVIMIKKNKLQVYFIMIIVSLLSLFKNDELSVKLNIFNIMMYLLII